MFIVMKIQSFQSEIRLKTSDSDSSIYLSDFKLLAQSDANFQTFLI